MELRRTSGNFEIEHLHVFLRRVEQLVDSGFSDNQILQVQKTVEGMQIDASGDWEFPVQFRGSRTLLRISIFMDETELPKVTFLTQRDLSEGIDEEMIIFSFEKQGE